MPVRSEQAEWNRDVLFSSRFEDGIDEITLDAGLEG